MTTSTDAPEASAPVVAAPIPNEAAEPVAEPPVAAEGGQLSLKVRTLDQKTYPITIGASASVPQLKELVAEETGVTQARQRLIYRGRVLKNDQPLAAYSLEDGHVLHLVARAEGAPTGSVSGSSSTTVSDSSGGGTAAPAGSITRRENDEELDTRLAFAELNAGHSHRAQPRGRSRRMRSPPAPRDNDEPDPTMGRSASGIPSRLLMGATISVPEGADVTMPFLSSMIANLVTQAGDGEGADLGTGAPTGTTADGRRHVSFSLGGNPGGNLDQDAAATARVLRLHRRNRDGSGSSGRSHSRRSSTSAERQAVLRTRAGQRLDTMRATLDDASLDFPVELTALQQGDNAAGMAEFQQQVGMLQTLMDRFGPRLRLLPAALAQRDRLTERQAQDAVGTVPADPTPSVQSTSNVEPASNTAATAIVGSTANIEPTANVESSDNTERISGSNPTTGDSASTAVSARHVIRAIETLQSIGEAADFLARMARHAFVRQSMHLGETIPRRGDSASSSTSRGGANASGRMSAGALAALEATNSLRRARAEARDAASTRPRFRLARIRATAMPRGNDPAATTAPDVMPGSSSNFPVDLTGSTAGTVRPVTPSDSSARSSQSSFSQQTDSPPADESLPPPGPHISIAGLGGLPVMSSVVFPFSLAAGLNGNHATTTWNLADFVYRLTSELPISTLYGVLGGDNTNLHHLLAHVGFALFSGVDVPRVSRPNIRTWAQDFVVELRNLLRSNALPADVLEQVVGPAERRLALGTELINALEPFMPELVDTLVRATSASRAAAFGASSSEFLRTMARQVVSHLRSFARGESTEFSDENDSRLEFLLQRLLVWLGLNEHMADFVVDRLLSWTEDDSSTGRRSRIRRREDSGSGVGDTDEPTNKRRRDES